MKTVAGASIALLLLPYSNPACSNARELQSLESQLSGVFALLAVDELKVRCFYASGQWYDEEKTSVFLSINQDRHLQKLLATLTDHEMSMLGLEIDIAVDKRVDELVGDNLDAACKALPLSDDPTGRPIENAAPR